MLEPAAPSPAVRGIRIAIDGPAASGKGTVARAVATALGYLYIDTGAMYRALGLAARRAGLRVDDAAGLSSLASGLPLDFAWDGQRARVMLGEEDVSVAIREPEIGAMASAVAVHPQVRAELVRRQQLLAARGRVVVDGRDIGTVVLPDAELKLYLDASLSERARRRHEEFQAKGERVALAEVEAEIRDRDAQDSGRATGPLQVAPGAVLLDTTGLGIDEVVQRVLRLAQRAGA